MKTKIMKNLNSLTSVAAVICFITSSSLLAKENQKNKESQLSQQERPNILFIMADDLNDFIGVMNSDIGVKTPNIDKLAQHSTLFTNAHSNAPVCSPSRASLFSGILPHESGQFGFGNWRNNKVLANSKTIMEQLSAHGYHSAGVGKLTHQQWPKAWDEYGLKPNYGPLAFNGNKTTQHPDVPAPYNKDIGPLDSTFIPLSKVPNVKPDGKNPGYNGWYYGGYKDKKPYPYQNEEKRALLPDEAYANWAVDKIKSFEKEQLSKPFFLGVGFIRPHTPLVVPDRFFEMYPIESIQLPAFTENDASDTYFESIYAPKTSLGRKHYTKLLQSYPSKELALKSYYQAYLASVSFMDEQVGKVLNAVENSKFNNNTLIVFTSDHGYNLGEKDNLFKNNLWDKSTRIPLIVFDPQKPKKQSIKEAISLVDLYPTFMDYANIDGDNRKNEQGKVISGYSIKPLIDGNDNQVRSALTVVNTGKSKKGKHFSLRTKDWRYIQYGNGKEELYHNKVDPNEINNLESNENFNSVKIKLAGKLKELTK